MTKPNRKTTARISAPGASRAAHDHDRDYSALLNGLRSSFEIATRGQTRLFTTDAKGLWEDYLAALPKGKERQIHDCNCCRRFIQAYGGLVAIAATGEQWPVMWRANGVPEFYKPIIIKLYQRVDSARVTGVFLTTEPLWGLPETTGKKGTLWQHLSVVPPAEFVYRSGQALDPHQAMALAKENIGTVLRAMAEYGPKVLDEALRLFKAEALDRSEKFVGPVQWLRALHDWPKGPQNALLRNKLLWRAVAHAPEGFCHIKSSIVGPLLDDIAAGVPFADIKRKHADKLHPLKYQRPQAAPTAGNIRAAEQLVEKMGIAPSLERRFARLDELPLEDAFWTEDPVTADVAGARPGVFSHLLTKQRPRDHVKAVDLPQVTMTWEKFKRTRLIDASEIQVLVPHVGAFTAFTTAVHADAPPIMKWDREEERNPVCWYHYHGGSPASQWRLSNGTYARVLAIMAFPSMWGSRPMPHLFTGAVLVIEGCLDTRTGQGNALFPETLRDDLHGARSTIESYSKSATLGGREAASACGITMGPGSNPLQLRALIKGAWNRYVIDRLD